MCRWKLRATLSRNTSTKSSTHCRKELSSTGIMNSKFALMIKKSYKIRRWIGSKVAEMCSGNSHNMGRIRMRKMPKLHPSSTFTIKQWQPCSNIKMESKSASWCPQLHFSSKYKIVQISNSLSRSSTSQHQTGISNRMNQIKKLMKTIRKKNSSLKIYWQIWMNLLTWLMGPLANWTHAISN